MVARFKNTALSTTLSKLNVIFFVINIDKFRFYTYYLVI
jgi:hypothetical protein